MAMSLSGCGTKAIYATDYCRVAEPISLDDQIERSVLKHNLTYEEICGEP